MDQSELVKAGHTIVRGMDDAGIPPQLAMWVRSNDADIWKLWIVPPPTIKDKPEFYRLVSEIISKHRSELGDTTISDIEMQSASHPAVQGLSLMLRFEGLGSARLTGNQLNGFYLPDGIVLRSAIARKT